VTEPQQGQVPGQHPPGQQSTLWWRDWSTPTKWVVGLSGFIVAITGLVVAINGLIGAFARTDVGPSGTAGPTTITTTTEPSTETTTPTDEETASAPPSSTDRPTLTTTRLPAPASGPTWSITPEVVQPGQRWTFTGSGFQPGGWVELQAFGGFLRGEQADATGAVRIVSTPADVGSCAISPMTVDVVHGGEVLGSVTVRFCS
jgi:hypothetical protein